MTATLETLKVALAATGPLVAAAIFGRRLLPARWRFADRRLREASALLAACVLVAIVAWCGMNLWNPRAWDFPHFYVASVAALEGDSFYQPTALREAFDQADAQGNLPEPYVRRFPNPIFVYPPPTIFLLGPLGMLDYRVALALHYLVHAGFFAGAAWLLTRVVRALGGDLELWEVVALIACFAPVQSTFGLAQLAVAALFFLALSMHLRPGHPYAAGAALGLGAFYKPVLVLIGGALALRGHPRLVTGALVAGGVALAASAAALGPSVMEEYLRFGTSFPPHRYTEPVTQSLMTVAFRVVGYHPVEGGAHHLLHPAHLLPAIVVAALSGWLLLRAPRAAGGNDDPGALATVLLVSAALLLYPGTLFNTVTLILPAYFILYSRRESLGAPPALIVGFLVLQYAVTSIRVDGNWWFDGAFVAVGSTWLLATLLILRARPSPIARGSRNGPVPVEAVWP